MDLRNDSLSDFPALEFVFVEGGEFEMGDKFEDLHKACRPVHQVKLSSYYMSKYLVTQNLWEAVMGSNPSYFKGANHPVDSVSKEDSRQFIKRLNALTKKNFRLPTEAEWEYAARGGMHSQDYKYAGSDKSNQVGWYRENSNGTSQEVGQLLANELGLYDMSGNVWEWCEDWYEGGYYTKCKAQGTVENPVNNKKAAHYVLRGGSYFGDVVNCRPTFRNWIRPTDDMGSSLGLRLASSFSSII
ncbi:MAG: formylglycine-generating enzyme family protein [Saprospiraceae bacterium]